MYEIKLYNILKNKMRVVFFCENLYAIDILLPIHKEALSISDNASPLWYVHAPRTAQFPLKDEVNYTTSIQDVYDFSPDVIFVPGNIVLITCLE